MFYRRKGVQGLGAKTLFIIAVSTTQMIMPGMPKMLGGMKIPGMTGPQRTLTMDLTSDKAANASSKAECAIPEGLKLGPKVDLIIDLPQKSEGTESAPGQDGADSKMGKTVIKYYWMCGETVPQGQPKILDTEKMMAGVPKGRDGKVDTTKLMRMPGIHPEGGSRAYWPGGENPIKDASQHCPGGYNLTTNYCGGTSVTLDKGQDFLAPIELTSPKAGVDLAKTIAVEWKPVPNALAYILTAFGSKPNEMIIWTSSGDPDVTADFVYRAIPVDDVTKYIAKGILLPPDKTMCRIPAGIFEGCEAPMLSVIAVGADKLQTKDGIETHVTVRSTATAMLGGGMGMGTGMDTDDAAAEGPDAAVDEPADDASAGSGDAADDANDGMDKVDKVKGTINRAKDILKW